MASKVSATAERRSATSKAAGVRHDAVINVRLPAKTRDLIDSAAALSGKTRTEFMLESARQHATDVLLEQRLFSLDGRSYEAFLEVLDNPPAPSPKLRALLTDKAPWEA